MQVNAGTAAPINVPEFVERPAPTMTETSWHPIATAPFNCDLELAVLEGADAHALVFRCRRARNGWINAATGVRIDVEPTHWREWPDNHRG